jgi:hypothetical protein
MNEKSPITIHDLFPSMDEKQQKEAEENLTQYLDLVMRIFTRLETNRESDATASTLTPPDGTLP